MLSCNCTTRLLQNSWVFLSSNSQPLFNLLTLLLYCLIWCHTSIKLNVLFDTSVNGIHFGHCFWIWHSFLMFTVHGCSQKTYIMAICICLQDPPGVSLYIASAREKWHCQCYIGPEKPAHLSPFIFTWQGIPLGLWELCSKFLSLFYSEFLLKSLHYAQFYSFYATDSIIILHLASYN